jgi:hypothetical protein
MSQAQWHNELRIPSTLALKLGGLPACGRSLGEAIAVAAISVLVAFLAVFASTGCLIRRLAAVGVAAAIGCRRAVVSASLGGDSDSTNSLACLAQDAHRRSTVGNHRTIGESSGANRRALQAAIDRCRMMSSIAIFARASDSRLRTSLACAVTLIFIVALPAMVPAAASNAFARLSRPWAIPDTFACSAAEPACCPRRAVPRNCEAATDSA